jgi:hypothetical protein
LQQNLKRLFLEIVDVEHRREERIPIRHRVKQPERGERRQRQRQNNADPDTGVIASVDTRRFFERRRDAVEEAFHQQHIPSARQYGQDQGPYAIDKSEFPNEQVRRDDARIEQSREQNREHQETASLQPAAGQSVGQSRRDGEAERGADGRQKRAVQYRPGKRIRREQILIRGEAPFLRP